MTKIKFTLIKLSFFFIMIASTFYACSDNMDSDEKTPSNLQISYDIDPSGNGVVTIEASAENTDEYWFYSGESASEEPVINQSGTFEYQYEFIGTYTAEVRAVGESGKFLRKNINLVVLADVPDVVGEGYSTPIEYDGMQLLWNDEFNGTSINPEFWTHEIGDGCPDLCGWGNNELQYYIPNNTSVNGGLLTIEARKETIEDSDYTSSRIITRNKFDFTYGRVDIRALLPKGQGLWPALWLLGSNQQSVGWPACGEIDIMEMIGGQNRERTSYGNVYWFDNGKADFPNSYTLPDNKTFYDEYHVFSIIWDKSSIKWYVNDFPFHSFEINYNDKEAFQNAFFLICNVAVGGNFPGSPNSSTEFPTSMKVDYIRVFQSK